MTLDLHSTTTVAGCITQEKFLRGRTLQEIERLLGFHPGRLSQGMIVAALIQVPQAAQFNFGGYTQVAGHHFQDQYGKVVLDKDLIKKKLVNEVFKTQGPDRLVKVIPNTRHNDAMSSDTQYPPGQGIPQWVLTDKIPARVVVVVNEYPHGRY